MTRLRDERGGLGQRESVCVCVPWRIWSVRRTRDVATEHCNERATRGEVGASASTNVQTWPESRRRILILNSCAQ